MSYRAIRFTADNKGAAAKFLGLPAKLYGRRELMQDKDAELALLRGEHLLSKYFKVYPILVLDEHNNAAARCVVTVYPDRNCAYFGFFESINDIDAARAALDRAKKLAHRLGRKSLCGPVDCSFWIRYRLKTDHFGRPYTGEPYNKDYYEHLLTSCGFGVCGEYISNNFPPVTEELRNEKFEELLDGFLAKGYRLEESTPQNFDKCLHAVYVLLIELYSDFQTYSRITEDEFSQMFSPLRHIIDGTMVRIAYYNDEPVGFFISIPDIGNAASGRTDPEKLFRILMAKRKPKRYIMMYMGALKEHHGLGKAMSESIRQTLAKNGASSVSALIRKGKVNSGYYEEALEFRYTYKLFITPIPH